MSGALATAATTAAALCTAMGVLSAAAVLVRTRDGRLAIAVLLELLLAAGLLRLAGDPGWDTIVTAAAVVALRHLLTLGLRPRVG